METFYIYASQYELPTETGKVTRTVTVFFCDQLQINSLVLQSDIKKYYESNYQTDEILVIGGLYAKDEINRVFVSTQQDTFKYIPKLNREHLAENMHIVLFEENGDLSCESKSGAEFEKAIKQMRNDGLANIFSIRGGLIQTEGDAHHFVFPSGKHCNKFLRTGNILLHSTEISFIAHTILGKLDLEQHRKIYCDTSSINSLAYSLVELKSKFRKSVQIDMSIESFSSYSGILAKTNSFFADSIFLISSSTSGNIIEKIRTNHEKVSQENIIILYYLGKELNFIKFEQNILCNLTIKATKLYGIPFYETFNAEDCVYCRKGSVEVQVQGDVFLLEKPQINKISILKKDAPVGMSNFAKQFISSSKDKIHILKTNYKESRQSDAKYEAYFDMRQVLISSEDKSDPKFLGF